MTTYEISPFGTPEIVDNPEPRCPCVLLLDVSGSMSGAPIRELNDGLAQFKREIDSDPLARRRVEVCIVTFGPVELVQSFVTVDGFFPPVLHSRGDTPMGAAIGEALRLLEERKSEYRRNAIEYYKPWVFLITDGAPTDSWHGAAVQVHAAEDKKSLAFFAVGVQGANFDILGQIATRTPMKLKGLAFRELFLWLSNSMRSVSRSTPGTAVALPSPSGWTEV